MNALLERVTRVIETALIVLLFGMFAMVIVLVVLRYLFSTTIIGGNEGTVVAFIFTTALGASIAIARDEHIAIDYFTDKMPPQARHALMQVRLFFSQCATLVMPCMSVSGHSSPSAFLCRPTVSRCC